MDGGSSSSGKGKQKAAAEETERPDTHDKNLGSRLVQSATGLLRSFTNASAGDLTSTLATSSAIQGKSQQSNTSAGSSAWNEGIHESKVNTNGNSNEVRNPAIGESFRSQYDNAPLGKEMDYFLTQTDFDQLGRDREPVYLSSWTAQFNAANKTSASGKDQNANGFLKGAHAQAAPDGTEVVQLLSEPAFDAPDGMGMGMVEPLSQEQVSDLFRHDFTDTERQMADIMRSSLPPAPEHKSMPPNHPLNFRPAIQEQGQRGLLSSTGELDLDRYFASPDLRDQWLAEWDSVLNSYTDEVWGELLPEVQTAKTELKEMRDGRTVHDHKTIARLKMILAHINQGLPDGAELRPYARSQRVFACPHTGCKVNLADIDDWAAHIGSSH